MTEYIVALDLDGTVVDYENRLSDYTRAVIRAVARRGHHVVIATGRTVDGALDVANRLGLTHGYVVASNGAVIVELDAESDRGWDVYHVECFDPGPALERMSSVLPEALYMVEDTDLVRWSSGQFPDGDLAVGNDLRVTSFEDLKTKTATRIVMREMTIDNAEFEKSVQNIGLHGVTYSVGWSNWLDIQPDGVSKASAIQRVGVNLGVEQKHTIGAGDGSNDVEMLQWVETAIVMGQSKEKLGAYADIIAAPVEEDGLAEQLVNFFDLTKDEVSAEFR